MKMPGGAGAAKVPGCTLRGPYGATVSEVVAALPCSLSTITTDKLVVMLPG